MNRKPKLLEYLTTHSGVRTALLCALVIGLAGCDRAPEPKWLPGIPDSYDMAKDGRVWLGPYRFTEPKGLAVYNSVRFVSFQLLVDDNRVSFYDGTLLAENNWASVPLPEGAWLSRHSMSYDAPIPGYPPPGTKIAPEVSVDLSNREMLVEWHPPIEITIRFPGIRTVTDESLTFICYFSAERFKQNYEKRDLDSLLSDPLSSNCRTFFGVRPGVRVLIDFPCRELLNAPHFVHEMIVLLKTTVTEK